MFTFGGELEGGIGWRVELGTNKRHVRNRTEQRIVYGYSRDFPVTRQLRALYKIIGVTHPRGALEKKKSNRNTTYVLQ